MITGRYNRYGYNILDEHGEPIYSAGNHSRDSGQNAPLGSTAALPLRIIRSYCISTAREMAQERNDTYGGVTRIDE